MFFQATGLGRGRAGKHVCRTKINGVKQHSKSSFTDERGMLINVTEQLGNWVRTIDSIPHVFDLPKSDGVAVKELCT